MAITDLGAVVNSATTSSSTTSKEKLGRSDFLKMFITQMQNQDPLNPLEGTEFTSQLAQFSSLEQLFNINESSNKLLEAEQAVGRMEALKLMGKEVQAEGNSLILPETGGVQGSFSLAAAATQCTVSIYDGNGNLVRTLDLGALNAGNEQFSWDGLSGSGKAMAGGTYLYKVQAKDMAGKEVPVATRTSGVVTGVKLNGTVPSLTIGTLDLPLSQVISVREPATTSD